MFWQDVLLDRVAADEELADAFAQAFGIPRTHVQITKDVTTAAAAERVQVMCERTEVAGDFPLKLAVFVRDPQLEALDSEHILRIVCAVLDCRCLIPDESENPYTMLLLDRSGRAHRVSLDPQCLDTHESYVLVADVPQPLVAANR